MSIVVIGVNHRTGPLELLERLAIPIDAQGKAIAGLVVRHSIREAVVLSTCNRTEIYVVAERFHGAYADIRDFLCDLADLGADELHPHLYSQHDEAAVSHLFEVAAGLDSAVLGESEILGQVRSAWELAQSEGGAKATLNLLFRHAVETGKRARTETSIGRGTTSVSHAAVEMATERLGSLVGRRVLVVGAGEMGEGIASALVHAGANNIDVVNRTADRAKQLAHRIGGRIVPFADLPTALAEADVLLTCTGAGGTLIDFDLLASSRGQSASPLLIVDIAVPRDVAHEVTRLAGVTLLNLDDLRDWAGRALVLRAEEARLVNDIVSEEVERFGVEAAARQAAPLVAQLRQRAETIRRSEIERFTARLASLDEGQRAAVEAVTKGIVAKLLHSPSVKLKDEAGTPQGERNAATVRDLFDLG
jgi:glutamyl-tRNA reductase